MSKRKFNWKKPLALAMAVTMSVGSFPLTASAAEEEYKYVYAALTWDEYWENEGVFLAEGSSLTASSSEKDAKGETDKGAFDAVSRATTNHGLHRGSFQCIAVIYDENQKQYPVSHWSADGKTLYLTDGTEVGYNKGTLTYTEGGESKTATLEHYEVTGNKYIPVKVKTEDYDAFKAAYSVTENDSTLTGGYGEQQLAAYEETAAVTADTNGIKTAVNNGDGTFSFGKRETGSGSGVKDQVQKTADNITVTVKDASGSYGEFLRVDLTGDGYGDLGSNMYAVCWDYYGSDSTRSNVLASYGTKFAADNWMHKSMGIQLGLTESLRCQLPKDTDGTGYWSITVYAMGYQDYKVDFEATEANIVEPSADSEVNTDSLKALIDQAKALKETDYTPDSWKNMMAELEEAEEEYKAPHTQATVDEAYSHLNEAVSSLVKVQTTTTAAVTSITLNKTDIKFDTIGADETLTATVEPANAADRTVTWSSSDEKVATVDNGTVKAAGNGTATITAKAGDKTATAVVTVSQKSNKVAITLNGQTLKGTLKAKVKNSYSLKAVVTPTNTDARNAKVTWSSSNKKIATVTNKGKVTIKKKGTVKITAKTADGKKATITLKADKKAVKVTKLAVQGNKTMKVKKSQTLKVTVTPATADNQKVSWKSSNTKIATVNSKGKVTVKKKGTVKITATAKDGSRKKAVFTIKVK